MMTYNDWEGMTCSVCGGGFTQRSWDERHTDPRDHESDCHARCCPRCKLEVSAEKRETAHKAKGRKVS